MKRIILFFAVCLGLSVSQTTFADDAETARAAAKRTSSSTTTVSANQSGGRTIASNTKRIDNNSQNSSKNSRTATKPQQRVVVRTAAKQPAVRQREAAIIKIPSEQQKVVSTTSRAASSRTVASRKNEVKIPQFNSVNATSRSATSAKKAKTRAAELNTEKITNIKSLNFSKCKTVYYECMDEFCANKDTNLRRCACSSRIHEFDGIKKQLSEAEDKMFDFNQRLLTVSLDKEDAAAINTATEGELAFSKKDTSQSEKLLQKITSTLNDSGNSKINNNLSAISLSLDMDSAWDNVDALSGVATSSKSGLDLYNAASPVCIEMAREVCNDEELDIAQSSYKLSIQQDCDTVAKSYKTQYSNAMEKIYESSALLDMSRLNVYQQRNSDDTLTCKRKILEQLSDTAVCGKDLYKCLDTTGQYIDPSTGSAFLSTDLYNLTNLLQEPGAEERWSKIGQNESFVKFLDSKKTFLEPAIEQCQDISDMVWQDFLDDALSQIKLAQNAKLEEIRRSCTTLVAECKTNALQSLSDFDARALSTFSVAADKTVNGMCSEIQESCTSLMNNNGSADWGTGMQGIAMDITYQNVMDTCATIGRDCIVQQCNGTSGNFALCQKTIDDNRRALLNRTACWEKVLNCVKEADNLDNMENITDIYAGSEYWTGVCANNDKACYIAKQIWGNCEYASDAYTITTRNPLPTGAYKASNKILIPGTGSTLLSWFASNTGTADSIDSCNSNGCPIDYQNTNGTCQQLYTSGNTTTDGCSPTTPDQIVRVTSTITNYCESGVLDVHGNCCVNGAKSNGICVPSSGHQAAFLQIINCTQSSDSSYMCPHTGNLSLYCVTTDNSPQPVTYYQDTAQYGCGIGYNSMWIMIDENGNYFNADSINSTIRPQMYYNTSHAQCYSGADCTYGYDSSRGWDWSGNNCSGADANNANSAFLIRYITN